MFVCENTCSRWQNRIWNHWRGKQRIGNQRETCSSGVGQGGRELPTSWAGCCHLGLDWVAWQITGHPLGTEAEQGRLTTNDFFTVSRASMFLSDELRPAMCLELLPQAISLEKNRKKFFAWNGLNRKVKPRDSRISKKFFAKLKFSPWFWKTLVTKVPNIHLCTRLALYRGFGTKPWTSVKACSYHPEIYSQIEGRT